jgi:hypothetical protein
MFMTFLVPMTRLIPNHYPFLYANRLYRLASKAGNLSLATKLKKYDKRTKK